MQLFIDTNIYLAFYQLTSEDLEELNKLAVLVEQGEVTLYLTDQVRAEFERNREIKIAEAVKRLREQRLNLAFPQMCRDYPEYTLLRKHQVLFEEQHSLLINKMAADAECHGLNADKTIRKLFDKAKLFTTNPKTISKARLRMDVGNPPGKNGSLGDAISWELLLDEIPESNDLYFITEDRDYVSALSEKKFREFLIKEWESLKQSQIIHYKKLSLFFKDKFPHIRLAAELEKSLIIQKLASSKNFATTHAIVARLREFSDFTATEANAIVTAALSNKQVAWIARDEDVEEFLSYLVEAHRASLDPEPLLELSELLAPPPSPDEDDDFPF